MKHFEEIMLTAMRAQVTVMYWGRQGIGKTEKTKQFAEKIGGKAHILILSQCDATDILGVPYRDKDGVSRFSKPHFIADAEESVKAGKPFVLLFDELNRADAFVINAAHDLILQKRVGEYYLPTGNVTNEHGTFPAVTCVAACNPPAEDEVGLTEFGAAFLNRFAHIPLRPDPEGVLEYAKTKGWDEAVVDMIRTDGKSVVQNGDVNEKEILGFGVPTARSLEAVSRVCKSVDCNPAIVNSPAVSRVIMGLIGKEIGTKFIGSYADKIARPLGMDVMNNPKKLKEAREKIQSWKKEGRMDLLQATADKCRDEGVELLKNEKNLKKVVTFMDNLMEFPVDLQAAFWQANSVPEWVSAFSQTVESDIDFMAAHSMFLKEKKAKK